MKKFRKKIAKAKKRKAPKPRVRASNLLLRGRDTSDPTTYPSEWWEAKYDEYKEKYRIAKKNLEKHGVSEMNSPMYDLQSFKVMWTAYKNDPEIKDKTHGITNLVVKGQKFKFSDKQARAILKDLATKKKEIESLFGYVPDIKGDYVQIRSGADEFLSDLYARLTQTDDPYSKMSPKEAKKFISQTIFGSK